MPPKLTSFMGLTHEGVPFIIEFIPKCHGEYYELKVVQIYWNEEYEDLKDLELTPQLEVKLKMLMYSKFYSDLANNPDKRNLYDE